MSDKNLVVRQPFMPIVTVPEGLRDCDVIEVRVTFTPLRWHEQFQRNEPYQEGKKIQGVVQIVQIEARDGRAVMYVLRQLLRHMAEHYLGLDIF